MARVGLDQGQAEEMDLPEQKFDAFVFGHPCLHVEKKVFGNVHRACFVSGSLAGHMLSRVERSAVVAATGSAAATVAVDVERASENR